MLNFYLILFKFKNRAFRKVTPFFNNTFCFATNNQLCFVWYEATLVRKIAPLARGQWGMHALSRRCVPTHGSPSARQERRPKLELEASDATVLWTSARTTDALFCVCFLHCNLLVTWFFFHYKQSAACQVLRW